MVFVFSCCVCSSLHGWLSRFREDFSLEVDVGVVVVVVMEVVLVMMELVSVVVMEFTEDEGDVDDATANVVVAATRSPLLFASVALAVTWAAIVPVLEGLPASINAD